MRKVEWNKLILVILSMFLLAGSPYEKEEMLPSGLNDSFNSLLGGSFQNYIQQATIIIKQSRLDLDDHNADFILQANSPFILYPPKWCQRSNKQTYDKGIILMHDLGGSPYQMRELGYYFSSKCYLVYTILFTGHGTRPGDMLNVKYQDWLKQLKHAVLEMRGKTQKIFLGGHGLGGVVALHYLLNNTDQSVSGLFLSATPTQISQASYIFLSTMSMFKKWGSLYPNRDKVRYETIAINGHYQKNLLLLELAHELNQDNDLLLNIPVFALYSTEDNEFDFQASINLLIENTMPLQRKIVLYSANPTQYQALANQTINLTVLNSSHDQYRMLSLSHLGLLHKLNDIWYGLDGAYRDCYRYTINSVEYKKCLHDNQVWYGEAEYFLDRKNIVARATFNPYLEDLFEQIFEFFNK